MVQENPLIDSIKPLTRKFKDSSEQANEILHRVAAHVLPVMKAKNFKVGKLEEMYPSNPGLLGLNVNRGRVVRLRLRHPGDPNRFLLFDDIIGTMLHELVHNLRGPHDAQFYKLLDELFGIYESALDDGYQAEGQKLGGRNVSDAERRQAIIDAAQKRKQLSGLMGPAQKVGSGPTGHVKLKRMEKDMTPAQMAAWAAERRLQDAKWCASQENGGDMVGSDNEDETVPHSRAGSSSSSLSAASSRGALQNLNKNPLSKVPAVPKRPRPVQNDDDVIIIDEFPAPKRSEPERSQHKKPDEVEVIDLTLD